MAETTALMFEVGIIMLVAFMGAAIASRFRLSVIIGYIVAGILIGPHVRLDVGGLSYRGVITDNAFITDLSRVGLILLLFFVGLQFSIEKLKRTKQAAVVLALVNLGVNLFAGFVLGTYLGWPLIDTIFLAGVVAMSSSAITSIVSSAISSRRAMPTAKPAAWRGSNSAGWTRSRNSAATRAARAGSTTPLRTCDTACAAFERIQDSPPSPS